MGRSTFPSFWVGFCFEVYRKTSCLGGTSFAMYLRNRHLGRRQSDPGDAQTKALYRRTLTCFKWFPIHAAMMGRKNAGLDSDAELREAFKVFDKDGCGYVRTLHLGRPYIQQLRLAHLVLRLCCNRSVPTSCTT